MTRALQMIGFLSLNVLLAGALFAPGASAQFESESESTTVTTSSNAMQKFAPSEGGAAVECTKKNNKGLIKLIGSILVLIGSYESCETFLGAATSIKTNGCQFVLKAAKGSTTGTVDIECEAGKAIEVSVGSICKYTIGTQTGLSSVSFKNTGAGTTREIIMEPNVKGITSTRTTNDFFCPAAGSTGTYTGSETLTGESAGGVHIGVFVD
jgi:hypothetical protein